MKTRLAALIATAMLAALTAAPAAQATVSCSVTTVPAPSLGGGITASATGKCNVDWMMSFDLQYESGGTWHYTNDTGWLSPGYSADTQHTASHLFTGISTTPYCAYNWRTHVQWFTYPAGAFIHSENGATLQKTC